MDKKFTFPSIAFFATGIAFTAAINGYSEGKILTGTLFTALTIVDAIVAVRNTDKAAREHFIEGYIEGSTNTIQRVMKTIKEGVKGE